ncbi:DUF2946 family protein [Sphingomonas sp. RB3P16]|uniref:DUF2946 family protein n=1 Tax=Parasphingomonas frigoris TaxID=3096163 RepID=UPI002FCB18BA
MTGFRHFLLDHRLLAAGILALALMLKMLVPAGFMVGSDHGVVTIEICSGFGPMKTMAMPGMPHHPDKTEQQGKEMPCAFSGLAAAALAAIDPLLLAVAIAFIIATVFRVTISRPAPARPYLRPPLRGPPLHG